MINAVGRQPLYLQSYWAAIGVGITGALAAFFISRFESFGRSSRHINHYDLRDAAMSMFVRD